MSYHSPSFLDITEETEEVKEAIAWALKGCCSMAEIYPLGGAADRYISLVDEEPELPAAKLAFAGENIVRAPDSGFRG